MQIVTFPGFCDVHVHLREPGFAYKETIKTGTLAAAAGGYTAVCPMPNLSPVPDSAEHLREEQLAIARDAVIGVYPVGAMTVSEAGELPADLEGMASGVCAYSDDGKGVQSESLMRSLMERCRKLNKLVTAHCEVNDLLRGGYIHDGAYAREMGHRGICSESEWRMIERDLKLAEETGCRYHVCHISCWESVELIRRAKKRGIDVTCETAPHYLLLDENDLQEDGRFKMNPPLRSSADREALLEGVLDGTVDCIATDHAPHSAQEKSRGLEKSLFGVVGLETAFPVLYTGLVKTGLVPLQRLIEMLTTAPRARFGIPETDDICVWDLGQEYVIDPSTFQSMGRATPFEGMKVFGKCLKTVYRGQTVYEAKGE